MEERLLAVEERLLKLGHFYFYFVYIVIGELMVEARLLKRGIVISTNLLFTRLDVDAISYLRSEAVLLRP